MGMVPRSISTIKEWREPPAKWSPKTRSGTTPISCTTPWCESFTRSDNGLRAVSSLLRKTSDDVVGVDELHVASSASGELQRDREIDDLQLMLDEWAPGLTVLPAPFDVGELDTVALDQ